MVINDRFSFVSDRPVEWIAVVIGVLLSLAAYYVWDLRTAAACAGGAAMSLLNYRWLKLGISTLTTASRQADQETNPTARGHYVKTFGRYVLLLVGACVILWGLKLPAVGFVLGLFASVAAIICYSIWHLAAGH